MGVVLSGTWHGLAGSCLGNIVFDCFLCGDTGVKISCAVAYVVPLIVVTGISCKVAIWTSELILIKKKCVSGEMLE